MLAIVELAFEECVGLFWTTGVLVCYLAGVGHALAKVKASARVFVRRLYVRESPEVPSAELVARVAAVATTVTTAETVAA